MTANKKMLLRWCGWFFTANTFLACLISFKYLTAGSWLATSYLTTHLKNVVTLFILVSYIGQLAFIIFSPCLIILPLILLFSARKTVWTVSIVSGSFIIIGLLTDSVAYSLYHFHLNSTLFLMLLQGLGKQFFGFSVMEYFMMAFLLSAIIIVEGLFAVWIWRRVNRVSRSVLSGRWIAIFLCLCLYISYGIIFFSAKWPTNRIFIDESRALPFYSSVLGMLIPKQGVVGVERMAELYLLQPKQISAPLNYPQHPLHYTAPLHPLNVVIIAVDAWRFDMVAPKIMPTVAAFAKKGWVFRHHISGGNATGPGIFTLFYGIPSTYWTAMETQHQGPVLLQALLKQHYLMGVYSGYSFSVPPFDKTVFQDITHLQTDRQSEKTPYARDRVVTEKFKELMKKVTKTNRPFFSFLFYSAAHNYCQGDESLRPLQPTIKHCNRLRLTNQTDPQPYLNRYKNSLQFIDQQIQQVLNLLRATHQLDHTVVIITGDHGEEFNDNHLDYWGHASNFTQYQVHTPLIVYWPGAAPRTIDYQTTHFDIAPTLMQKIAGCHNAASDYSLGTSLLDKNRPPYIIIGSYVNFGIVEREKITTIFQSGVIQTDQLDGKPALHSQLNLNVMRHVLSDLRQFYRDKGV